MTAENMPTEEGMPEGMTAEQRQELLAQVQRMTSSESTKTTISGSQAVDEGVTSSGADVNWDEYDVPFALRHFYKASTHRETPEGPRWVAETDEFMSIARDFGNHGKRLKDGTLLNLGEYLQEKLNDGHGWRAVSILPTTGGQAGVLLQRKVPYILPIANKLKTDTEVAPPTDPELKQAEDAALSFMMREGLSEKLEQEGNEQQRAMTLEEEAIALNGPGRLPGEVKTDWLAEVAAKADAAIRGEDKGSSAEVVNAFVERSKDDVSNLPPTPEGWDTH